MPLLAHGENLIGQILLGLLCYVALIGLSVWTLLNSGRPELRRTVTLCAVLVAVVSGVGAFFGLKQTVLDSRDQVIPVDDLVGILFWVLPLICGVTALVLGQRAKSRNRDTKTSKL